MTDPVAASPEVAPLARALTGQYTLEGEIGRGGMGIVYRARDLKLDRPVAIKVLPPYIERESEVRERFLREARTAASLSHPNIVPIYRADEIDGHVFFAMAYVQGESVAQRVRRAGPMPTTDVVHLLQDVARALDYAHDRSVIHRDVKAENILIDDGTGRALITDFGIARFAAAASMTATGQLLGTVWYMSPEQVMGQPVDGRSDLYGLGVVGFYALSGRFPFEYESPAAVLVAHATKPAPPLATVAPQVPVGISTVIDRLLAKDAAARFQTGDALARALDSAAATRSATPVIAYDAPPMPAVLSETDARALWRRAAELQAETGRLSPPPNAPVLRMPVAEPDAAPTSGYRIRDVLGAASEAGIGDEFVARAAAQLGLVSGPTPVPSIASGVAPIAHVSTGAIAVRMTTGKTLASRWRGAPDTLECDAEIDGNASERELEVAVELIRRSMRQVGVVSRIGRSLSWSSVGSQRQIDITITSRSGKTVLRANERLGRLAGGLFGGIVGGVGGGGAGAALGVGVGAFHSALIAAGIWLFSIAGSYTLARSIYTSVAHDRQNQLRRLVTEIAEYLRDGIEPDGPPHQLPDDRATPGVGR